MIRAGLLAAGIALSALACNAQTSSGSFTISGVVRSVTTGAPLDRAEVTLSTAGDQETEVAETATGESGAFRFDGLAAGKYALAASRRGFIPARYQEHEGGYSTAIVTGADQVSEGLPFNLFPTAVMGGTITDDSGDAVGGAQVTLYRQQQQEGETSIVRADNDSSSDDGSYEFDNLRPGTYYLGVSANPWYAFHPVPRTAPDGTLVPPDQQPRSPLDVAYPMTFYANATDSGSATPIQVNAGDHSEMNLTLHAEPAVHMGIRVPKPDPTRGFSVPQLEQDVFGEEQFLPPTNLTTRVMGDQMIVDLGSVAPGHYGVREYGPNGATRSGSVDLTSDQMVDLAAAGNVVDVSGKLELLSGAALPPATMLELAPGGGNGTLNTAASADGSFDLRAVPAAEYTVQVTASTGLLDIVQMAASGAEVRGHRIIVGTDPVLLAATLAHGSVSIAGFARRDGKGLGGVMILLVPEDAQDNADLIRRDQSDSDGSFTLRRVLAGNYTLVAIEKGWSLEWSRPDVLAPYLARGVKLHIAGQQQALDLPAPLEVQ
ncbi:MAG TPA: carboxypeptidase-like regulatory domain-containing protein [Acidobacteriaceae bacterium]|jgi:uncharacterized protein (DUF2141 family)|nr:carboxypeptidase-like regulatory domain-containing protein [Acidobacteriaceae bacterium]